MSDLGDWENEQRASLAGDRLIAETMKEARRMATGQSAADPRARRPMTEEEIQAADDAYFERLNRGWTR